MKDPLFGVLRRDGVLSLGHHRFISATMIRIVVFWCRNNPVLRMLCYENVKSSDKFPSRCWCPRQQPGKGIFNSVLPEKKLVGTPTAGEARKNVETLNKIPATKFLFPNFLSLTLYKKSCFFG